MEGSAVCRAPPSEPRSSFRSVVLRCLRLRSCLLPIFFLLGSTAPTQWSSALPLPHLPLFQSRLPLLEKIHSALARASFGSPRLLFQSDPSSGPQPAPPVTLNHIRKPRHDHREYRYVELPNRLKVLLISDSKCDEAAASIRVAVGSTSDPEDVPGLAHFTEHMLFQGSQRFPGSHDFFDFIHEHGGVSNAFTSKFSTVFSFSIGPDYLDPALDRMADAFTNPLLKDEQFSKEIDAVHSEFTVDFTDDAHRVYHLLRQTSRGGPFSHFTVGNHESLLINTKKLGIDPLKAMKDFHDAWYSSNLMTLSVIGRESLDELERLTRRHFSRVVNKDVRAPVFEECSDVFMPLDPKELGSQTLAIPQADIHDALFVFYLPPQARHWLSKPLQYIATLLGHQGPTSLASQLRRRGLATGLSVSSWSPELCTVLQVGVSLTEKGRSMESIYEIGELLFIYIRGMSSTRPERWRFAEAKLMSLAEFSYTDMPRPFDLTVAAVEGLYYYAPAEVLAGGSLLYEFDPESIKKYLRFYLTPDNLRLFVFDKKIAAKAEREEHWFKIRHQVGEIPKPVLDHWRVISKLQRKLSRRLMISRGMDLPGPNAFLPNDTLLLLEAPKTSREGLSGQNRVLITKKKKAKNSEKKYPELLSFREGHPCFGKGEAGGRCNIFHKQDDTFGSPKTVLQLQMYYAQSLTEGDSTREHLLTSLYVKAVNLALRERFFDAHQAGLSFSLGHGVTSGPATQPAVVRPKALTLQISGFSDKLGYTLRALARAIARETARHDHQKSSKPNLRGLGVATESASPLPLSSVHTHNQPAKDILTTTNTTRVVSAHVKLPGVGGGVEFGKTNIDRSQVRQIQRNHTTAPNGEYDTREAERVKSFGAVVGTLTRLSPSSSFSPSSAVRSSTEEPAGSHPPFTADRRRKVSSPSALEEVPSLLEECFLKAALESLKTRLRVAAFSRPPSHQASARALEALLHPYIPVHQLYRGLLDLEKELQINEKGLLPLLTEVQDWSRKIWRSIYVEGLVQGNISRSSAEELIRDVITELPIETLVKATALERISVLSISDLRLEDNLSSLFVPSSSEVGSPSGPTAIDNSLAGVSTQPVNGAQVSRVSRLTAGPTGTGAVSVLPAIVSRALQKSSPEAVKLAPPSPQVVLNSYDKDDGKRVVVVVGLPGALSGEFVSNKTRGRKSTVEKELSKTVTETENSSFLPRSFGGAVSGRPLRGQVDLVAGVLSSPAVYSAGSNPPTTRVVKTLSSIDGSNTNPSSLARTAGSSSSPLASGGLEPSSLVTKHSSAPRTHVGLSAHINRLRMKAALPRFSGRLWGQARSTQIGSMSFLANSASRDSLSSGQSSRIDWRSLLRNPVVRRRWIGLIRRVLLSRRLFSSRRLPSVSHSELSVSPRSCPNCFLGEGGRPRTMVQHVRAKLPNVNPNDTKNQSFLLIEVGPVEKVHGKALLYMVYRWMSQRYFNELRTKQQLGYLTSMSIYRLEKMYYYVFRVTSTFNPAGVTERTLQFLRDERARVLGPEEFNKYQRAAIDVWKQKPKNIFQEFRQNLRQIVLADQIFDINERMVDELQRVNPAEIQAFREASMFNRPWLVIELYSQREKPKTLLPSEGAHSLASGYVQPWRDVAANLFSFVGTGPLDSSTAR